MLDIRDLTKSYGETRALDGVSVQVRAGQMYGFVGGNGAGKSTITRIAMKIHLAMWIVIPRFGHRGTWV
jgi:ABC-2 type transport system ATP-binding protein